MIFLYFFISESTHVSSTSANTSKVSHTRDVDAIILDVHLMQAGLSGSVFDSNSAVLVVSDVRLGHLARWHSNLTFSKEHKHTVSEILLTEWGNSCLRSL